LLATGATRIDGGFTRGDLVTIEGPNGTVARGLAEYDAADTARLLGRHSDDHAAILGYAPRSALVHRNHLALV
jgi:glutamate 5-kinase